MLRQRGGGGILNLILEIERISFFEALKLLAETNGIVMPKREFSDPPAPGGDTKRC
jgi:hypothetical protein